MARPVWSLQDPEERLLIGSTLVEGSTLSEDEAREVLQGMAAASPRIFEPSAG